MLASRLFEGSQDIELVTALIRGLSATSAKPVREAAYLDVLNNPRLNDQIEVLAAISGRAWSILLDKGFAELYLRKLAANNSGQDAFELCLEDLLFIPEMRRPLMQQLRALSDDSQCGATIQHFFTKYSGQRTPETSI
jgi:hypothetical protein